MNVLNRLKCRRINRSIGDYLDGRIPPEEKSEIENHIKTCRACALEFSMLEKIQSALKSSEIKSLPAGYAHELHHKLVKTACENRQNPPRYFQLLFPKVKYAVICLLLILIPFSYLRHKNNKIITYEFGTLASINLNQVSTFKLRINSPQKIKQANLKIEFSGGIKFVKNGRMDAYKKEIVWCGDLDKGENIIAIYVVGVKQGNWPINATIKQNSTVKKLILPVHVI